MDLSYTEEQESIRKMVRDFCRKEMAPGAEERDRTGEFHYELYRKLGRLGVPGIRFPEEYAGTNQGFLAWCLALEEIGKVDLSLSWTLFVGIGGARRIILMAGEEQKREWKDKWVAPVVKGEAISCAGITEPDAGSDTAGIKTTADLRGGEWVINGTKAFITNAGLDICTFATVLCLTDRARKEFSTLLVPTGTPGYKIMPKYRKMGLRSSDTRELAFEDCRVPAQNIIGERGVGRKLTVDLFFVEGRLQLSSTALGLAQACFEEALKYAQNRVAFKRPISQFQHVQGMLVDMAVDLELSRLLRDKGSLSVEQKKPDRKLSSMAKYFCCESAKRAADHAVQIHGAVGYIDECAVSRYYRDIRAATIADGTTEIQKWIIARELGC